MYRQKCTFKPIKMSYERINCVHGLDERRIEIVKKKSASILI